MSNAVSTFVLATGLKVALGHVDKAGLVKRLADDLDSIADKNLAGRSERFQQELVTTILLPLARELMKEDLDAYKRLLIEEAEPFRKYNGGEPLISGSLGPIPGRGQAVRPKNRRA